MTQTPMLALVQTTTAAPTGGAAPAAGALALGGQVGEAAGKAVGEAQVTHDAAAPATPGESFAEVFGALVAFVPSDGPAAAPAGDAVQVDAGKAARGVVQDVAIAPRAKGAAQTVPLVPGATAEGAGTRATVKAQPADVPQAPPVPESPLARMGAKTADAPVRIVLPPSDAVPLQRLPDVAAKADVAEHAYAGAQIDSPARALPAQAERPGPDLASAVTSSKPETKDGEAGEMRRSRPAVPVDTPPYGGIDPARTIATKTANLPASPLPRPQEALVVPGQVETAPRTQGPDAARLDGAPEQATADPRARTAASGPFPQVVMVRPEGRADPAAPRLRDASAPGGAQRPREAARAAPPEPVMASRAARAPAPHDGVRLVMATDPCAPATKDGATSDIVPVLSGEGSAGAAERAGAPRATPVLPQSLAQPVAAQVASVARPLPDGAVEITLQPEELGRLRLTFGQEGGAVTVAISADRPETLDLLRRHADLLARELEAVGYDGARFDFGGGGGGQATLADHDGATAQSRTGPQDEAGSCEEDAPPAPSRAGPLRLAAGQLDLRL